MDRLAKEAELVARARAGDEAAFEELVAPYEAGLRWELQSLVGVDADQEELLREALEIARIRLMRTGVKGSFEGWVRAIARRLGEDEKRRRAAGR